MEAALIIFALMVLITFLGLGYATVKVAKATKRGVDRTLSQARRTVEDTTLRARSIGQTGVAGSLAQLRLDLRTSMRSTQQALQEGARVDASLQESVMLFERLSVHGRELDDELKRLEQDPDRQRITERMPDLRERTAQITKAADSLRWAARDRASRFAEDELSTLSAQIEMESGALRDWRREPPVDELAAAAAAWDAAQASGTGASSTTAPGAAGPAGEQPRAALDPAAPQTPYPWQKTRRPESTT
ncbi:hypothetical protein [Streptomyces sp. NPDC047014]|uniref:hypothetical protein n=1 Tax=Streptomyces sp. NPDC047014 TaxID=3155736 RepID=UPI0033F66C04